LRAPIPQYSSAAVAARQPIATGDIKAATVRRALIQIKTILVPNLKPGGPI